MAAEASVWSSGVPRWSANVQWTVLVAMSSWARGRPANQTYSYAIAGVRVVSVSARSWSSGE
jgi:hypothetical protein